MRLIQCVPDEKPLAADLIRSIRTETGCVGVRVDVSELDHEMWAQARSIAAVEECYPIYLLFGGTMRRRDGGPWQGNAMISHVRRECAILEEVGYVGRELAIEIANEPDVAHDRWKKDPRGLGEIYAEAIIIVRRYSLTWRCLSPSVANLNDRGLRYIEKMRLDGVPGREIAFHRYPAGCEFQDSHLGSRDEEVRRLREIAGGVPLWNTETGWAEQNGGYQLSEAEVAERMANEIRFWERQGVESLCLYQLNSGTWNQGDSAEHKRLSTYGFRRVDGSWKPVAAAVKEAHA